MTAQSGQESLSHEARELLANLNGLAAEIMCDHYDDLTVGMRLRASKVIKDTKQILDEDPTSDS